MKKVVISSFTLLMVTLLFTGCVTGNVASADGKKICSRKGEVTNGTSEMNYEIYYEDDYVTILHSIEKVTSDDSNILDTYEEAYKNIFKQYEGLKYYDNTITRNENSITSDTTINYAKIDIEKLLEIEGAEDNVVKDGKVKISDWLSFAEKYGVTCEEE